MKILAPITENKDIASKEYIDGKVSTLNSSLSSQSQKITSIDTYVKVSETTIQKFEKLGFKR